MKNNVGIGKPLVEIISIFKDGSDEPLDGDEVEKLGNIIKAQIDFHEGNITFEEYGKLDVVEYGRIQGAVLLLWDGIPDGNIPFTTKEDAEQIFIRECEKYAKDHEKDHISEEEIKIRCADGYLQDHHFEIRIIWF